MSGAERPAHKHHGHKEGEWFWACCACSGLPDPGCEACESEGRK